MKNRLVLALLLAVLAGFGVSIAYLVPWSMIPDVIDLDELKTRKTIIHYQEPKPENNFNGLEG